MKTIIRNDSRYKPKNLNGKVVYLDDQNLVNMIKRADEYCIRYNLEYAEPIYIVRETQTCGTMTNTSVRLKSNKSRYNGQECSIREYYEVKLIKKESVAI